MLIYLLLERLKRYEKCIFISIQIAKEYCQEYVVLINL